MGEMTPVRGLGLLFVGLLGFFGFFAHGYVENTDAEITMHAARAWYLRGDPGLLAEGDDTWVAERFVASDQIKFGMVGTNGRYYVWFPIGHQMLMVPFVALGERLAQWYPQAEADYRKRRVDPLFNEFFWTRFCLSFLPAICAAGSAMAILLIVSSLGCSAREALLVTGVTTLCTQFWPGASETMSDGPGMFFLLAMAALVFRARAGVGGNGAAFAAGLCGGWAVLVRYPHAIPVAILAAVLLLTAWRQRSWSMAIAFVLGALPEAVTFFAANWLRFGDIRETGYSAGANPDWWGYWWALPLILLAPGKGILFFSTPLWLAIPAYFHRRAWTFPWLPALLIFVLPFYVYGQASGWAGGQCWSVRYMTPSVVLLVAVALACAKPWQRFPKTFAAVCVLGFAVSAGGVVTSYHAQQKLAYEAAPLVYPPPNPQIDNNVNFDPAFSPLHTHWIYAFLSASGRLEQGGAENTIGPLFGVYEEPVEGRRLRLPVPSETAGFRHWWMVGASHNLGMPFWPVFLPWWLVTAAALWFGVKRFLRGGQSSVA